MNTPENPEQPLGQAMKHFNGPHAGKLIDVGNERVELCVAERGGMCFFRLYFYHQSGQPEAPFSAEIIKLKTVRADGAENFVFRAQDDSLESMSQVAPPHVFTLVLTIIRDGRERVHTVDFTARDDIHDGPR